jgi:hypothetical protein
MIYWILHKNLDDVLGMPAGSPKFLGWDAFYPGASEESMDSNAFIYKLSTINPVRPTPLLTGCHPNKLPP